MQQRIIALLEALLDALRPGVPTFSVRYLIEVSPYHSAITDTSQIRLAWLEASGPKAHNYAAVIKEGRAVAVIDLQCGSRSLDDLRKIICYVYQGQPYVFVSMHRLDPKAGQDEGALHGQGMIRWTG